MRTTRMSLVELMILKDDAKSVIEYLGKRGNFQFQNEISEEKSSFVNSDQIFLEKISSALDFLSLEKSKSSIINASSPTEKERERCQELLSQIEEIKQREIQAEENLKNSKEAFEEASSFANLKIPYEKLENVSFLSLKIGKINPEIFDELIFSLSHRAVIVPLGEDKSKILAASSKKGRFSLDSELKKFGFIEIKIAPDFKGVPDEVLKNLSLAFEQKKSELNAAQESRKNFSKTHAQELFSFYNSFSIAAQISQILSSLESTQMVFRITGWIPENQSHIMMEELDSLTEGRTAIRLYNPTEVPSVISGREKVPVQLSHGKFVSAFRRMIFSYGSPVYGAIDPTPFVAIFFTILFGIMFGDAGQGLVFLLAGILMAKNVVKVGGWNKFAPIFMGIGGASMIMGFLTGEFFATEKILLPVSRAIKTLFGETNPQKLSEPILLMMPSAERTKFMFMFFACTVAVGFVINSIGIVINIVNKFLKGKKGSAIFGKTGISGALFFWSIVFFAVKIVAFGYKISLCDWIFVGLTLFFTAFASPFSRILDGERPVLENGFGTALIEGVVEILEVISSYLSNSISFLRVGAFALAHAVLGYIISSMSELAGGIGGIAILVLGNAIVIVLEGMIVAIQVVRLQYYEFFSKFFSETGKEFKPFKFK